MKRKVVFGAWGVLALSVAVMAAITRDFAFGTVLDGFSINTQEKAVTVTLYTDQHAQYSTENHGRQFTIVLPNAQLSQKQVDNGLPVVIDNKNRFIGRAVPTPDGNVKIILPNLPASEYAVSIQQQQGTPESTPTANNALKPRPAVNTASESRFEQVTSSFAKPRILTTSNKKPVAMPTPSSNTFDATEAETDEPTALQASRELPTSAYGKASRGTIWNPYVVKRSTSRRVYALSRPSTRPQADSKAAISEATSDDSPSSAQPNALKATNRFANLSALSDASSSLTATPWYLNPLPASSPNLFPAGASTGHQAVKPQSDLISKEAQTTQTKPAAKPTSGTQPKQASKQTARSWKGMLLSLPTWLWMSLALFLGGIGLFGLIGSLVLLRLLFSQLRPVTYGTMPSSAEKPDAQAPHGIPNGVETPPSTDMRSQQAPFTYPKQTSGTGATPSLEDISNEEPRQTRPSHASVAGYFEDTATVNALDYMPQAPSSVSEAVHNAILIKFPLQRAVRKSRLSQSASSRS